jgi:hypothetical protein
MFKRICSLAVLAVCGLCAVVSDPLLAAAAAIYAGAARMVRSIFAGPPAFAEAEAARMAPNRPLLIAKAFMRTLEQRKRPKLTPTWRMCPST